MSAEISIIRGKAEMAYVGEEPWHGLGQKLTVGAPLEVWAKEAGMNWRVQRSKVHYAIDRSGGGAIAGMKEWPDRHVLFRSDTKAPLAVVSDGYQIVQPGDVLEFFRDLTAREGWALETAGTLFGGGRYWALAKTGHSIRVKGVDPVGGYLLLATSADGSIATTAKFESIRVVCNNTLSAALGHGEAVRVRHSSKFDASEVKVELGLLDREWEEFGEAAGRLAARKLTKKEALMTLVHAWGDAAKLTIDIAKDGVDKAFEAQPNARVMAQVIDLFDGKARGANLASAKGTAWGLVNAATQYFDHAAGRSQDSRLASAWFGTNANRKTAVFEEALKLAA